MPVCTLALVAYINYMCNHHIFLTQGAAQSCSVTTSEKQDPEIEGNGSYIPIEIIQVPVSAVEFVIVIR